MKRLPLYVLAFATTLSATAATAQTFSYVLVPTISPGVTVTKVEMVRTDLSLTNVEATYVADGESGLEKSATVLKAYVGPSTSKPNPLLNLTPILPSGGMVMLAPVAGLDTVEVSMEVEQAPVRTAWKLPLLAESDFFPAKSTIYVLNLVKQPDASSNLQLYNIGTLAATCSVKVLRPKGSVIEERDGIIVPAVGVTGISDIMSKVPAASAEGINAAVTCDQPFYALGAYPATNRWDSRVEYPVASSLLLPVVSTRCPPALDSPISTTPRTRACRFSAGSPVCGNPAGASSLTKASTTEAIGIVTACTPCRLTRSSASLTECSEE